MVNHSVFKRREFDVLGKRDAVVYRIKSKYVVLSGHAVAQLVEELRYKPEGRGFDFRWCHWNFSLTQFFRPHYGPGVDSASNKNEYQEYFLGVKAAGAYGWQPYHFHVPIVLKSGSPILLERSGLVQACHGIALPFAFYLTSSKVTAA